MALFTYKCTKCSRIIRKVSTYQPERIVCACGGRCVRERKTDIKVYNEKHEMPSHRVEILEKTI